ncbi:MAG: hypothetical protein JST91_03875 [Actinobacteria bacterium]|nr:hypothetical protein [Actinomycetota bacterium]
MTALHPLEREAEAPTEVMEAGPPPPRFIWLPWATIGLAAALFLLGLPTIPSAGASQWGLLAVASPAYAISILLTAVGFAFAIRKSNLKAAVAATILMIIVQRLPRTITTDMPMYAWTYKHLGVVDYIQHAQTLARDVDIYNGWPGLFALTAWFSNLTGISATTLAHWYTPVFHVFLAGLVYGVARAWRLGPKVAITATFLVVTLNWVEQDYYSPQATTMLLVAGIFMLVGLSRDKPVATLLLIVLFTAATVTHQLTPYWVFGAIGLLVLARQMRPWWIVLPLGVILVCYLMYNWEQANEYTLFSSDVIKNAESNIPTVGVMGQRVTSGGVRILSASIWVTTGLVLLYRMWRRKSFWALGVLSLSPMLILGGQSYGGEAIFRVFLYSIIGCCIVLAPVLTAALERGTRTFCAALAILLGATALSAQGYTGSWYANVMPKIQVDTSKVVLGQAELPAYLTAVAPVWPERSTWRYVDYARFDNRFDGLMINAAYLAGRHFDTDEDYAVFIKALESRPDASTYLIITDQMRVYSWYFGILPWDALPNLKERLKRDTVNWEPFYDGQGITVFLHRVDTSVLDGSS